MPYRVRGKATPQSATVEPTENMVIESQFEDPNFVIVVDSDDNCADGGSWILQYSEDGIHFDDDTDFSPSPATCDIPVAVFLLGDAPIPGTYRVRHDLETVTVGYSNSVPLP